MIHRHCYSVKIEIEYFPQKYTILTLNKSFIPFECNPCSFSYVYWAGSIGQSVLDGGSPAWDLGTSGKDMGPVEVLWGGVPPRKDMGPLEVLWDGDIME